jgi:hypothetical protein
MNEELRSLLPSAGILGVAHPSFSVLAGGYFPGLVTSPVVGVLGGLLLRRLLSVTDAVNHSPGSA